MAEINAITFGFNSSSGSLDDTTFSYGGQTYTIDSVHVILATPNNGLNFSLDAAITDTSHLVLDVDGTPFAFDDATFIASHHTYSWLNSDVPAWSENDTVALKLLEDAPTVTSIGVEGPPANQNDSFKIGDTIRVVVEFDLAVAVTGAPRLELDFDGTRKRASCAAHDTDATKLDCTYTVVENDADPDGIEIGRNKLANRGGSTIKRNLTNGADAVLDHDPQAASATRKVDGVKPTLVTTGADAPKTSTDGTKIILTFSEAIRAGGLGRTVRVNGATASTGAPASQAAKWKSRWTAPFPTTRRRSRWR